VSRYGVKRKAQYPDMEKGDKPSIQILSKERSPVSRYGVRRHAQYPDME
jgi:hypothetical protein